MKYLKDRSIIKIKKDNILKIKRKNRIRPSRIKKLGINNILEIEDGARMNKSNI